jgi:hypothetical protein
VKAPPQLFGRSHVKMDEFVELLLGATGAGARKMSASMTNIAEAQVRDCNTIEDRTTINVVKLFHLVSNLKGWIWLK